MQATLEHPVGECCPTTGQGVLVLKLAHMIQFREEIVGNDRVMHWALCNDDVKGE